MLLGLLGPSSALLALGQVVGDGIELNTGRKTEVITDLSLPLKAGGSLDWKRTYRGDARLGSLGVGWEIEFVEIRLRHQAKLTCPEYADEPGANLEVQLPSVTKPCPNDPSKDRTTYICVTDGAKVSVFSDCKWDVRDARAGMYLERPGKHPAFFAELAGSYVTPSGHDEELKSVYGGWELKEADGTIWIFSEDANHNGLLTGRRDRDNNVVQLATVDLGNGNKRKDITGPGGRGLKVFINDRNLVERVEDGLGHSLTYTYDEQSRLVQVEGPGPDQDDGHGYNATYTYDALGRMSSKDDAKSSGLKKASYEYAATGQVSLVRDGLSRTRERYEWSNAGKVTFIRGGGQAYTLQLDAQGRLQKVITPSGLTEERLYNDKGDLVKRVLSPADGGAVRTESWDYDSLHNVTRSVDAENKQELWSYGSSTPGCGCERFATSHTDKRGRISTRSFDSSGHLTATTDAANKTTYYTYDGEGQRETSTSPGGAVTHYGYNATGDLILVQGPAGDVAYDVDALGRVTGVTDELGHATTYRLDGFGNAMRVTYHDGSFVDSTYDAHGNLTSQSLQTAQGQMPLGATHYFYDDADQLTSVTDPEGKTTQFTYDADGNRRTVTDPNLAVFESEYTAGRLTGSLDPLKNHTRYVLDSFGNRKEVIDARGNRTLYSYDKLDRLRYITDANNGTIEFKYDEEGNRRFMIDANTHETEWRYDDRGLLTDEIDAKEITVKHYTYDDDGNVHTLTDGNGVMTTYGYDAAGRLTSETPSVGTGYAYAYGSPAHPQKGYNLWKVTDPRGDEVFLYDDLDRLKTHTKPTGEVLEHDYDPRGNRTRTELSFRSGAGRLPVHQTWTYDKDNRNTQAKDLAGGVKDLHYDAASRLVREDLPGRMHTEYEYDAANRLKDLRNLDGAGSLLSRSRYDLDAVGNRRSKETLSEKDIYSYDDTYQLTGVRSKWADLEANAGAKDRLTAGVTKTVTVRYDPMGNRTHSGETYTGGVAPLNKTYTHNAANEMRNAGGIVQDYDDNGNLISRGAESLGWDHRNRLTSVSTPGKDPWSAAYDYNNRIHHKAVGAEAIDFIYDDLGRLWAEVDSSTGAPKQVYSHDAIGLVGQASYGPSGKLEPEYFHYDGLGSVVTVTDKKSNVLHNFSYGAFGEGGSDRRFGFTAQRGGLGVGRNLILNWHRALSVNESKWISRDPIGISGGLNLYTYTNNPILESDPSGLWRDSHYSRNRNNKCPCVPPNIGNDGTDSQACPVEPRKWEKDLALYAWTKTGFGGSLYRADDGSECAYDKNGHFLPGAGTYNYAANPRTWAHIKNDVVPHFNQASHYEPTSGCTP